MKPIDPPDAVNDSVVTFQHVGASTHIDIPAVGSVWNMDGREAKITAVATNKLPDGSWPVDAWPQITIAGKWITDRN